jgi:2-oxoglutarate ferredoxin oxidoreductase subunit alpha
MLAHGIDVDYLRVKGFPFNQTVEDFLDAHETVFVIEQNRDAQLKTLLTLETGCAKEKLVSILYYGGQPLSKGHVLEGIMPHMEGITAEVGS